MIQYQVRCGGLRGHVAAATAKHAALLLLAQWVRQVDGMECLLVVKHPSSKPSLFWTPTLLEELKPQEPQNGHSRFRLCCEDAFPDIVDNGTSALLAGGSVGLCIAGT